jgi:hypothetical protein
MLMTPGDPFDGRISVRRWDGTTWTLLGTNGINASPAAFARLAIDSGDGVTPYVAYKPWRALQTIVPMQLAGESWSELPALTRGLDGDFDFAVAGGQMYLAYLDGPTAADARVFVSLEDASGWTGQRIDADVDRPVFATRALAIGPAPTDVVVAWEATYPASGLDQVLIEQGPTWVRIPDVVPLASGDMAGFAMAASVSRIAVVWTDRAATPPFVGYFEFSR